MISVFRDETFLALLGIDLLLAWGLYVMVATGQLSLGQAGFMAVGAYASAWASRELGWQLPAAMAFGTMLAAVVSVPVAIGANRLRGVYLIIGTLAVGIVIETTLSNLQALGGVNGYIVEAQVDPAAIWLACGAVLLLLFALERSRFGLLARSVRQDEESSVVLGVPARAVKIAAVVIGATITGLAGAFFGHYVTAFDPRVFGIGESFKIALFVLIGGMDNPAGPALGAFVLFYLEEAFEGFQRYSPLAYGLLLIALMVVSPRGLVTRRRLASVWARFRRPMRRTAGPASKDTSSDQPGRGPAPVPSVLATTERPVLELSGLRKRFGGIAALDGIDLRVRSGEVLGLIGPNGAGKTTLVNVASGLLAPDGGSVVLDGEDMTSLPIHVRVRRGVARTFQAIRLFPEETVGDNVLVAARGPDSRGRATACLDALGLVDLSDRLPQRLPLGSQRRAQVAQALATGPTVLFLDEPSAGMDAEELEELAGVIASLRDRGVGVVLIDHNLDLVMELADRIAVLDFGRKIADGAPEEVRADERVRSAYLGSRASRDERA